MGENLPRPPLVPSLANNVKLWYSGVVCISSHGCCLPMPNAVVMMYTAEMLGRQTIWATDLWATFGLGWG